MNRILRGGTLISHKETYEADILFDESRIIKVAPHIKAGADEEISAAGKLVFPGFIDMHAHLRIPGREDEEDFHSAGSAAAKGGFTTICCMPNTDPAVDDEGIVQWIRDQAKKDGLVDIFPIAAVTRGRKGKELTEFGALKRAGCIALSDDGDSVPDSSLFKRALEYAKMQGLLVVSHCEDKALSGGGSMREGLLSARYGISAVPDIAETVAVSRDIMLARYIQARLHLAHISSAKSIEVISREKAQFPLLSCETAPHYLILTVNDVCASGFDANYKVNPPLGDEKDREALRNALREGVIDVIATDHAPHSAAEKELPFEDAPFGFTGMELAFPLVYTHLVDTSKVLSLEQVCEKLSFNPSRLLGLSDRGQIKEGLRADLVIVNPQGRFTVTEKTLASKSKNTPFLQRELAGIIEHTVCAGRTTYKHTA